MQECIAARATANGTGGVAIIRISGDGALELARKAFSPLKEIKPNVMYPGTIYGEGFEDYGFLVYFKAPKSFTGEDVVEFHCHGGLQIARGILKKCFSLGARAADRGEFTKRAFLNGKLSLASAEGMADMINAQSLALVRAGEMLYREKLTFEVKEIQDALKDVLARLAVIIDYPEEDESGLDFKETLVGLDGLYNKLLKLKESYNNGKKIKNGVTVAICGKPNVGKSSVLNALLGYDKALVSDEEGTTRDAVEGAIEIEGVQFNLVDTAGIRGRAGAVESMGIDRAKKIIKTADVVLSVDDGGGEIEVDGENVIRVFNKSDVNVPRAGYDVCVSAKTGEGLDKLKSLMYERGLGETSLDNGYIIEERHFSALCRAADSIKSALTDAGAVTPDLTSSDLKDAWDALGEITGETANEEIISTVFAKFCVGK